MALILVFGPSELLDFYFGALVGGPVELFKCGTTSTYKETVTFISRYLTLNENVGIYAAVRGVVTDSILMVVIYLLVWICSFSSA